MPPTDLDEAIAEWQACDIRQTDAAIGSLQRLRIAVTARIDALELLIADRKRDDDDDAAHPAQITP